MTQYRGDLAADSAGPGSSFAAAKRRLAAGTSRPINANHPACPGPSRDADAVNVSVTGQRITA